MHDQLARILRDKERELASAMQREDLASVRRAAGAAPPPRDFAAALRQKVRTGAPAVIAEIKFRSPSAGTLQPGSPERAAQIAGDYAGAGACCLSVLTDSEYFGGDWGFLGAVRQACDLPVLCKEFVLHPWQVWRARQSGADALLLIVAALQRQSLPRLADETRRAGMTALVEVHDEAELEQVLGEASLADAVIGINNRDLTSFETSLTVTERLAGLVPPGRVLVSESGIASPADMSRLKAAGVGAFLVGEALMRQPDPGAALTRLLVL